MMTIQSDHNPFFTTVYGVGERADWTNVPVGAYFLVERPAHSSIL